jgi:hypothetical protein
VKRSIVLFPLALIVPILFGCAPAVRVDHIQPVIPEVQVRKKYPMKVALIVPPATQNMNTITISRSNCFGGVSDIAPVPFGNTFKETAVGTFSKMFNEVDVLQGFTAEKEYDLIIETTLSSLAFKNGCQVDPGNYYQADGTVKLFDNDYREIWPGYRGSERQTWLFWTDDPPGPVIGNVMASLVSRYAQEVNNSAPFAQVIKERSKPKEHYAAGASTPAASLASAITSDIDDLPASKVKQNKKAYAIVVGIELYRQQLPKADYATQDARTAAAYLSNAMGYPEENIVVLLNDRALKSDLEKYFEKWLPNNVEPGSSVFVYYSGHGAPNPRTGDAYLVPYDGDPSFIDETGYSLKRLYAALGKLPAKEVVVALDSCFSGSGGRSVLAKGARPIVLSIENPVLLSKNITVLSASAGDQVSSTYDEKGHGLFTYFLLKGIKNEDVVRKDGSLDVSSLYDYVKPQVTNIARKKYNNEQTPQLIGAKNK